MCIICFEIKTFKNPWYFVENIFKQNNLKSLKAFILYSVEWFMPKTGSTQCILRLVGT